MKFLQKQLLYILSCWLFLVSCSSQKRLAQQPVTGLKFIGQYTLSHKMQVNGTTLGGLSSIDYNPAKHEYYLICDDRSDINPLRFYTAKIYLSQKGIDSVKPVSVTTLTRNGKPYHNRKEDSLNVPDPEALRFNQKTGNIVWSSEGERTVRQDRAILTDPSISISSADGNFIDTFPLPANMHMSATAKGPRNNGVFEGLAFSYDFKTMYISVEEPLYEDGHRAGLYDSTGWVRILKYTAGLKKNMVAQYAYQIDAIVQQPISPGLFIVNGVSDILAINDHQLLVTERSFSTGRLGNNIRVYLTELDGAEDIAGLASIQITAPQKPLQKKLLLNMDSLGILVDNIEGATFGSLLPNGRRSLIFVSDDNFSIAQKTQFLLFEVE